MGQEAVPQEKIEAPLWLWHGCPQDVVPKIVSRGFNRAFAGANATLYGKGVYFARGACPCPCPSTVARADVAPKACLCSPCSGSYLAWHILVLAMRTLLTHSPLSVTVCRFIILCELYAAGL